MWTPSLQHPRLSCLVSAQLLCWTATHTALTLALSQCPCFWIHPESLPQGPACQSVPGLALLGRSPHHSPCKKGHPSTPFTSLGSAVLGACTSLLSVLCQSSACSHPMLMARHPSVLECLLSWNHGLSPVGCSPSWAIWGCQGLFSTQAPRAWPPSCPHSRPREGRPQVESNQLSLQGCGQKLHPSLAAGEAETVSPG